MSELSELRKEVGEIRQDVARTATNVDWIRGAVERQATLTDKHDQRIGRLERWQHWAAGAAAAVGALLGFSAGGGLKS